MGNEYQKLLDAVANYYGRGSDQWAEIARYGLNADNCAEILKQTPNVNTVLSKDGSRIISYTVGETSSLATQGAGAVVNSNTQVATLSKTAELKYPAQMTVDSAGTVLAESGMKKVSTGATVKTVLGNVATGVAAVGCGVQLGALIDQTLYNANPDFWDSHNMSSLNPQTWDGLCSTQDGKDIFNMVFGVDKDTGETQAYIDQNAMAYIAQYLIANGVFNVTSEIEDIGDLPTFVGDVFNFPIILNNIPMFITPDGSGRLFSYTGNYERACIVKHKNGQYDNWMCLFVSKNNFTVNFNYQTGSATITPLQKSYNGKTFYIATSNLFTSANNVPWPDGNITKTEFSAQNLTDIPAWTNTLKMAYGLLYGNATQHGGVGGIGQQQDATTPSGITDDMTIPQVITQLQTLYPSLFDDAIYNDVVQEDGSTERITYIPVAIPDNISQDATTGNLKPTGGVNLSQDDSVIDLDSVDGLLNTLLKIIATPDPYEPTKTPTDTEPNAPDTGDGTTPAIVLPTGSANALYSIYNPSQAEVNSFGSWLWSSNFVDQLKKIFNDPMQAIIGLHKVFATPSTSGTGTIKVGYLDSEVSSKLVSNQYTSIDCGTIDLYEYFGNVLDYTETEIYIYLPFVGIVPLNVYDVMRSSINVKYKVDVLTGACLCSVNVTRDTAGGQLYTYSGNCAVQYPLSSGSYMGIVASALGVAGSVVGSITSGGAMLPLALGVGASALTSAKTRVEHSGSISGNAGAMGIKKPYIIIKRPQTAYANDFNYFNGIAQNEKVSLSTLSGFTKVKYVNLEGIQATSKEMEMIENELLKGVLI